MSAEWIFSIFNAIRSFITGIFSERSRQVHEAKQAHFEDIKNVVLGYLKGQLIDHYLRILERKEGILAEGTEPISGKLILAAKPPQLSLARTLGQSIALQNHAESYPHLYHDAKENHFPKLFRMWEQFDVRFQDFARKSIQFGQQLAKTLEEQSKIPPRTYSFPQERWINYVRLSIFVYERLWGVSNGALVVNEQSDKWLLKWFGTDDCGQGTKEQMESCKAIVDELLVSEKKAVPPLLEEAQHLKPELISIKDEVERLIWKKRLPGNCEYL